MLSDIDNGYAVELKLADTGLITVVTRQGILLLNCFHVKSVWIFISLYYDRSYGICFVLHCAKNTVYCTSTANVAVLLSILIHNQGSYWLSL